jgi:hypothetical protein
MRISATLPLLALAAMLLPPTTHAQTAQTAPSTTPPVATPQLLDRVVAVVNGDVILESDVEEEVRFFAFQLFQSKAGQEPRREALDRLIDRTLVRQQMRNQPGLPQVTDAQLDKELTQLRKSLPECAMYACYTDTGWKKFCGLHGFTPEQVADRWRERMLLLAFIEQRFRTGIRVTHAEIEDYYNSNFVPRFKERNLPPPSLASISDRIQEIILQQRVNALLSEWLKGLRDQGTVQVLDPTLALPADGDTSS